eukprot:gnl/MRDRNA2_/MRDRNA2_62232_c0_seq2.p1 gnl/MRDRNA2_/MRDRNA2_62232_c0~~gnl/MRDRNA2_/MRDRNA2_62232_c0_seq2.p1  ORF type:complete len:832 (-),score=197.36 gnl/MRDRNA2_/MRDRNA2_62232_c0_seq2:52-2466(-)
MLQVSEASARDAMNGNIKGMVISLVQKHLGRPVTQEDISWVAQDAPFGEFIGKVSIPSLGLHNLSGSPERNKKMAEASAAVVAHKRVMQAISGQKPSNSPKAKAVAQNAKAKAKAVVGNGNVKMSKVLQNQLPASLTHASFQGKYGKQVGEVPYRQPYGKPVGEVPYRQPVGHAGQVLGKRKSAQPEDQGAAKKQKMTQVSQGSKMQFATDPFVIHAGGSNPPKRAGWITQGMPAGLGAHAGPGPKAKPPGAGPLAKLGGPKAKAAGLVARPGIAKAVAKQKSAPNLGNSTKPALDPFAFGYELAQFAVRSGKVVKVGTVSSAAKPKDGPKPPPGPPPKALLKLSSMAAGQKRQLSGPSQPAAKKHKSISTAAVLSEDTTWTKRTSEEKMKTKATYEEWRDFRGSIGTDPDGVNRTSFDNWYASVCLVCLTEVQLTNFPGHAAGSKHAKAYKDMGGMQLHDSIIRPDPHAQVDEHQCTAEDFAFLCGYHGVKVLVLGEQDYSFSLRVAQEQSANGGVSIVATSYLAAHDPTEEEWHVKDDGERSRYSRRSLPDMKGALQQNLSELSELGGVILHSVDATNMEETLLPQIEETQFDVIVFPFPRASLQRGLDPRNSQLLRGFFRSIASNGLLTPDGAVELLMLKNQYAEWDTACMALEYGFELYSRVALPDGFYQSREMSGKPWKPQGGEMYIFSNGPNENSDASSYVKEEPQPAEPAKPKPKPMAKQNQTKSKPVGEVLAKAPAQNGSSAWAEGAKAGEKKSASWWALRTVSIKGEPEEDEKETNDDFGKGEDDDLNLASLDEA